MMQVMNAMMQVMNATMQMRYGQSEVLSEVGLAEVYFSQFYWLSYMGKVFSKINKFDSFLYIKLD